MSAEPPTLLDRVTIAQTEYMQDPTSRARRRHLDALRKASLQPIGPYTPAELQQAVDRGQLLFHASQRNS